MESAGWVVLVTDASQGIAAVNTLSPLAPCKMERQHE